TTSLCTTRCTPSRAFRPRRARVPYRSRTSSLSHGSARAAENPQRSEPMTSPLVAMKQVPLSARAQYELMYILEHYLRKNETIARRKEKARRRITELVAQQGKGKTIQVERLTEKISPDDFFRRYLSKGVPVILDKAAADWTCVREWSFDVFKQRYGHE